MASATAVGLQELTGLALKRLLGCTDELLDPSCRFGPVNLDAAAHVDPERAHLSYRGANVLWVKTACEQDWEIGANRLSGASRRMIRSHPRFAE